MLIRFPFLWGFDLGYRIIENDLFDQNWRSRGKADQVRYVVLKWTFCFAIGIITGIAGFVINLAVENVAGLKHTAVSALMESSRFCSLPPIALSKKKVMLLLLSTTNSLMLVSCFVYYYPVLFLSLIRSILVQIWECYLSSDLEFWTLKIDWIFGTKINFCLLLRVWSLKLMSDADIGQRSGCSPEPTWPCCCSRRPSRRSCRRRPAGRGSRRWRPTSTAWTRQTSSRSGHSLSRCVPILLYSSAQISTWATPNYCNCQLCDWFFFSSFFGTVCLNYPRAKGTLIRSILGCVQFPSNFQKFCYIKCLDICIDH